MEGDTMPLRGNPMRRAAALLIPTLLAALAGCAREEPAGPVEVAEASAAEVEKFIGDQKGKVVLIDCWATWCGPCVKTFPRFVKVHKRYAGDGLVCVSLNVDKFHPDKYKHEAVLAFLQDKRAAFPNFVVDPRKDVELMLKLLGDYSAIPHQVVYGRNGKKVWSSDDEPRLTDGEIDTLIKRELAKPIPQG
jgi:thiol-disulfide isomerase/thioredoxin